MCFENPVKVHSNSVSLTEDFSGAAHKDLMTASKAFSLSSNQVQDIKWNFEKGISFLNGK